MHGQPHISLDPRLCMPFLCHTFKSVSLQGEQVQILHACELWCEIGARVECALTMRPNSTSCIERQIKNINS